MAMPPKEHGPFYGHRAESPRLKGIIMIKGLALTPPVVGRIAIGKVVEKGGKRLPEKDDEFTLTSQVQAR